MLDPVHNFLAFRFSRFKFPFQPKCVPSTASRLLFGKKVRERSPPSLLCLPKEEREARDEVVAIGGRIEDEREDLWKPASIASGNPTLTPRSEKRSGTIEYF